MDMNTNTILTIEFIKQLFLASLITVAITYGIMTALTSISRAVYIGVIDNFTAWYNIGKDKNDRSTLSTRPTSLHITDFIKMIKTIIAVILPFITGYFASQYIEISDTMPTCLIVLSIGCIATTSYKSFVKVLVQLPEKIMDKLL